MPDSLLFLAPSPPGVSVSQNGRDSVLMSWTPPSGEPAVTGYIIYYKQDGGQRLSQSVRATATAAIITGLSNGTYSITVVATSSTLPSNESETAVVTIGIQLHLCGPGMHVTCGDNV